MLTTILLLIIGFFIVFLEFFLPGGILGVIGAVFLFSSLITFSLYSNSVLLTIIYFLCVSLLLLLLVKFILKNIRYGKFGRKFYSDQDQEGFVASNWDPSLLGKKGIVSTDLRPGGHILIEGKKYLAISQSGYIDKGEPIIIISGEGDSYIVKKFNKE